MVERLFLLFLLFSYSTAIKRQRSVLNVRKQLEYLESLIHRNIFHLREDLFQLQEQVNTTIPPANDVCVKNDDICSKEDINNIKRNAATYSERLNALAHGVGIEKRLAIQRREKQEELRSINDKFNSKLAHLETRLSNLESDFKGFKQELNETARALLEGKTKTSRSCPLNGFIWKSSCFVLNLVEMNWTDAVKECKARGGQLAILETEEEMKFVLPRLGQNTWIGGSDIEVEGQWHWVEKDEEIEVLLWEPGQPNGTGDCLEAFNGKLNDERCAVLNRFVCEYEV